MNGPASIVVIGAGVAGITAARQLRTLGYDKRLTVISAEDQLPYDRPPLSKQFLLGQTTAAEMRLQPAAWYDDNNVDLRLGVTAAEIRTNDREVVLSRGPAEPADVVLLATGGRPRTLAVPGADHPAVMSLRTMRDAESLRDRLTPGTRLAVVGAGLVGAEVTAAATVLGCTVTLLDPAARPFERFVGPEIAELLHGLHRRHGVRVVRDTVAAIEHRPGGIRLRLLKGADLVDCDVVVVGVGIEHDDGLAVGAGLARDRGVLVDGGQRTSHPYVFAAGDVARGTGPLGPMPASEHWDAGRHEGLVAAAAMLGGVPPAPRAPWFWSDRYGLHLEVVGAFGDGEVTVTRGGFGSDSFISLALRDGRCVGAVSVNRPAETKAVRRIVERGLVVDRDQLSDDTVDLRALARG